MTFADKLSRLRKESNHTQEQLADILGVSRQAISKWESGTAFPETEKLIRISRLYDCTLDYLLKDEQTEERSKAQPETSGSCTDEESTDSGHDGDSALFTLRMRLPREKKSERMLWGMPLYHIGRKAEGVFALGLDAKGIVAVGLRARGVVSVGMLSMGVLSFGLLSLGLMAAGAFALGLLAAGAICAGVIAAGAVSFALFSVGAVAVGEFSVGALAVGEYAALGDNARAMVALGDSEAKGSLFSKLGELTDADRQRITMLLDTHVPAWLGWAKVLFLSIIG